MKVRLKEKSLLAFIAAKVLKEPRMAVVLGSTIYLYGVSQKDFLANKAWLRHEMVHVEQFRKWGTVRFLGKYLMESIRNGYRNNKYEIEARNAE